MSDVFKHESIATYQVGDYTVTVTLNAGENDWKNSHNYCAAFSADKAASRLVSEGVWKDYENAKVIFEEMQKVARVIRINVLFPMNFSGQKNRFSMECSVNG